MKKTFTREQLEDMGLPAVPPNGGEIISDRIVGHGRWSVNHELVFREAGQPAGEAWRVYYSVGATEMQDERPWQFESEIKATLVQAVEKTVKVWEPVEESNA